VGSFWIGTLTRHGTYWLGPSQGSLMLELSGIDSKAVSFRKQSGHELVPIKEEQNG
jgi:hypothetical protein